MVITLWLRFSDLAIETMHRVLIIDDERMVRATLRRILETRDFEVLEAENGRVGLERYQQDSSIDLVMADIVMPEMEGIETIQRLRQVNPTLQIVAMSGSGRTDNKDHLKTAKEVGAAAVLNKPFAVRDVIQTINRCLDLE